MGLGNWFGKLYRGFIERSSIYKELKWRFESKAREGQGVLDALKQYVAERDNRVGELGEESEERRKRIEGLESELDDTRKKLELERLNKERYHKEARRYAAWSLRKRQEVRGLTRQLDEEKQSRDEAVKRAYWAREGWLRAAYREDTKRAYRFCIDINEAMRRHFSGIVEELALAKDAIEFRDKKIKVKDSRGLAYLLRVFGKRLGLDEVNGIYLDARFQPAYATQGFLQAFRTTQNDVVRGDVSKVFAGIDEMTREQIIETARGRQESSLCLQINLDEKEHKLELDYHYAVDKSGRVVGTFIEFNKADLSLMYKATGIWTRRKARNVLEQLFPGKAMPNPC